MEIYGNASTFNLENVLRQNIISGEYFRDTVSKLTSYEEVVDEIYNTVSDVEPWMGGNARGASTAFCLLYRLFTLKLSEKQINDMLTCSDWPYIRAIGFLYLRYVADPKTLWDWYEPYVDDQEKISPSPEGQQIPMGAFVRDLLLYQYYFETIFPRIPKKPQDEAIEKLKQLGLPHESKGNGGTGGPDRRGVEEPNRRPASVKASLSVAFSQRAPNRATAREAVERRHRGADDGDRAAASNVRSPQTAKPSNDRSPMRGSSRDRRVDERRADDRLRSSADRWNHDDKGAGSRQTARGSDARYDDRNRNWSRDGGRDRGEWRDRAGERGIDDRGRGRDDRRRDDREWRGHPDRRDDDRGRNDYRGRDYGRDDRSRRDWRNDSRRESRERQRSRSPAGGSRDASDVFKDSLAKKVGAAGSDLRSVYGETSSKLFDAPGRQTARSEEVYRLGGRGWR